MLTADEEAGSRSAAEWLAESGLLAGDAAVLGEPCGIVREWEAIDTRLARRRALQGARARHADALQHLRPAPFGECHRPDGAADRPAGSRVARTLCVGRRAARIAPTVNVGVMARAGVFYGVYPGEAEFACDIRTLPGMTREQVEEDIRQRSCATPPTTSRSSTPSSTSRSGSRRRRSTGSHRLVTALREASEVVLGDARPVGVFPGATDAAHLPAHGRNPDGGGVRPRASCRARTRPNESAPIAGILQAAELYALAARRYLEAS